MIEAAWVRLTGWPVIGGDADRCCKGGVGKSIQGDGAQTVTWVHFYIHKTSTSLGKSVVMWGPQSISSG